MFSSSHSARKAHGMWYVLEKIFPWGGGLIQVSSLCSALISTGRNYRISKACFTPLEWIKTGEQAPKLWRQERRRRKGNSDSWSCNTHLRNWKNVYWRENKYQGSKIVTKTSLHHPLHWRNGCRNHNRNINFTHHIDVGWESIFLGKGMQEPATNTASLKFHSLTQHLALTKQFCAWVNHIHLV